MTWIDNVLLQTEEAESPRSFIYWAALSAISAVMRKQVYLDRFIFKLYPNIYVMLVGDSGIGKSFPINLARKLVEATDSTRVIVGRNSIQSVITRLATSYTREGKKDLGILKEASGFLVSGEFANFIIEDPATTVILTDLYDTHANDTWANSLKTTGTEVLKDPCLTLLGGSNETHLKEALPSTAYKGGFIARTLMVQESKQHRKNPLTETPKVKLNIAELAKYLEGISKLTGPFIWTPESKKLYEDWYESFDAKAQNDLSGSADRLKDQILKVAMLISLSKRPDLYLEEEDIEEAIKNCSHLSRNVARLEISNSRSELGAQTAMVMKELLEREGNPISRGGLLRKFYTHIQAYELDKIIATLDQASAVIIEKLNGETIYRASSLLIEKLRRKPGLESRIKKGAQ